MRCNGCGSEIDDLAGTFSYGNVHITDPQSDPAVYSDHVRTLCPKCARVLKSILLNSDLSEHWEKEGVDG